MADKKKYEKYEKLAQKSFIFKPLVFNRLYKYSNMWRKKAINKYIEMYTKDFNLTKKELSFLRRDIAYCKAKYDILFKEYFFYNFRYKGFLERNSFIFNNKRQDYLYLLGVEEGQKTLRDKYKTYTILKDFYKREIIEINSTKDFSAFENYIKKHPIFVKKPINRSFGKGIELINSKDYKNTKTLFNELIKEAPVIIEEQIISDETMASLHPESLNTVRMITYRDKNDNVTIHLPFIKIGRGSSFVDNGGAGGMLAQIDPKTGIITTDAKDEYNIVYKNHPDTDIRIKGFQIPKWDEMVELAKKAALAFDQTRYIGFDVALSKDKGPIIVEGNGKTQFIGQQIPDEIGKRKSLEKLINYRKLKREMKDVPRWELPLPGEENKEGDTNEKEL